MNRYTEIQLSRLRQIGWDHWDPIGIRQLNDEDWRTNAADEYDTYLLHVVSLLNQGAQSNEVVSYLDAIVSEDMGVGSVTEATHLASLSTVEAIVAYLRSLPDGLLSFH